MKVLRRGLKKEDIFNGKKYYKSYVATENDVRLIVTENSKPNIEENIDEIDWKNNKAYIYMENLEASKKFYDKNKHLDVKLYIKADFGTSYNEYAVNDWVLGEKGIVLDLV